MLPSKGQFVSRCLFGKLEKEPLRQSKHYKPTRPYQHHLRISRGSHPNISRGPKVQIWPRMLNQHVTRRRARPQILQHTHTHSKQNETPKPAAQWSRNRPLEAYLESCFAGSLHNHGPALNILACHERLSLTDLGVEGPQPSWNFTKCRPRRVQRLSSVTPRQHAEC